MKPSKYNFYIAKEDKTIFFNAISLNYFTVEKKKENLVKKIIEDPNNYLNESSSFYNTLVNGKYIVPDDQVELDVIREKYNNTINSKNYKLILLPTLECNFRCWYCIQAHVKGKMSAAMVDRICRHLEFMIVHEKIESLAIEWFGGEPFKYFNDVVRPISIFARDICAKYNIPFNSSATTNAYLITSETVDQMKDLNFRYFQITLDGDREHHNKTRVAKKDSSFDVILNNVNYICSKLEDVAVGLRVNYDNKNLLPDRIIQQVNEVIDPNIKSKIEFSFKKIWQVDHVERGEEKLKEAFSLIKKQNFGVTTDFCADSVPCYANLKYYHAISFNGNVYKCTAKESMHENSLGYLEESGLIQWKDKKFEDKYYKPLFENQDCIDCRYLPVCMGPCPQHIENHKLETPKVGCTRKHDLSRFEDSISNYCEQN